MKCNVGGIDRIARIVVGIALVVYAFMTNQVWAYVGIIPLVTGLVGFCPLYLPFSFSTSCKGKERCNKE